MKVKRENFMIENDTNAAFWDKGFKFGSRCAKHPDQAIQEEWNKTVPWGVCSYDEFMSWKRGYLFGKKPYKG